VCIEACSCSMVQYFVEVVEVKIDIFVVILYLFHVFLNWFVSDSGELV